MYIFGARSIARLDGVNPEMILTAGRAVNFTPLDFTVLEGLRDIKRQRQLLAAGYSTTLKSYHLSGDAVDLGALVAGSVSWDMQYYYVIAAAMRKAAIELDIRVRWGGGWFILNDTEDLKKGVADYIARKRAAGKKPFIDGAHFQRESRV